jgi:ABC-type branched-subunit amino acid transport system substrate-binding protein
MLEGFVSAKVLVEGLRRAGRDPSRAALKKALETFNHLNLGGLELNYSATNHAGLDYSDVSIVGHDGKFIR